MILKEHREIKVVELLEQGGLLIKFYDDTHTYIPPEPMKEIAIERLKINE